MSVLTRPRAQWSVICSCGAVCTSLLTQRCSGNLPAPTSAQLLPIPDISNKKFPEAMKHEAKGVHRIMWHFSPADHTELDQIWNGPRPEDGMELEFRRNEMPESFPGPEAPDEPQLISPGTIDPELINYYAKKLGRILLNVLTWNIRRTRVSPR